MSPNFQEATEIAKREAQKAHKENPEFFNDPRLMIGVEKVGGSTFLLTQKTMPDTFYFSVITTHEGVNVVSADIDKNKFT